MIASIGTNIVVLYNLIMGARLGSVRQKLSDILNVGRVRDQLETYRHAFESTAADRDRLQQELNARISPPPQTDDDEGLGRYWQKPTEIHREILQADSKDGAVLFRRLVETGYVLQHALIRKREHIGRLIDWQIKHLQKDGLDLLSLGPEFAEIDILPPHTLFERKGRLVGTDFLRFLEYFHAIERNKLVPAGAVIVEVGSGYGGLARLMKLRHPDARIVLFDISETLAGAELYLRHAFPDSNIVFLDPNSPKSVEHADFVLCSVEDAPAMSGQTFDIAINTWSFGEMPNRHIDAWFSFLTEANTTNALFLTNHFMMPVCLESPTARAQLRSARWIPKIDNRWEILEFEIHPGVHGCGYWRHFQQGVRVVARCFENEEQRRAQGVLAAQRARDVYLEDWAQFSIGDRAGVLMHNPQERRAALLARPDTEINDDTLINMAQAEDILGIIKDDIRFDESSSFFKLWNHWRLTGSRASLRLLRVLLYLKWRPAIKNPKTGLPYTVISGEEYQFGVIGEEFGGDENLVVPEWMISRLNAIMH